MRNKEKQTSEVTSLQQHNNAFLKNISAGVIINKAPQLDVNIVFGMPSKNCQFHGICRIEPPSHAGIVAEVSCCNFSKAVLDLNEEKELIIKFQIDSMKRKVRENFFRDQIFIILEAFHSPAFVNAHFGKKIVIAPGNYPVITSNNFYEVLMTEKGNLA